MERLYFRLNDFIDKNLSVSMVNIDSKPTFDDAIPMSYQDVIDSVKEDLFRDETASILLDLSTEDYLKLSIPFFVFISLSKFQLHKETGFVRSILKRNAVVYPHSAKDSWEIACYVLRQCSFKRQCKIAVELAAYTQLTGTNKSLKHVVQKLSMEEIFKELIEINDAEGDEFDRDTSGLLLDLACLAYCMDDYDKALKLLDLCVQYAKPFLPTKPRIHEDNEMDLGYLPFFGAPSVSLALTRNSKFLLNGEQGKNKKESKSVSPRVKELESQIEDLKTAHEEEIALLVDILHSVQQSMYSSAEDASYLRPLEGRRVVVIGDDGRAPVYRAIIEAEGAEFIFLPGFDQDGRAESIIRKGDGILLITTYCGHAKWYILKSCGDLRNVFLVNKSGAQSFKLKVEKMKDWFAEQDAGKTIS